MQPLAKLRHHVTGAIERGEKHAIVERTPATDLLERIARSACLDQRLHGSCICFSCEAARILQTI